MEKAEKISQYRKRLDKTLASPDLTNQEALKSLVRNHLLESSLDKTEECCEKAIEKRTAELSNFLDMLRSASVNDNEVSKTCEASDTEWKLKQDNEEFRIMYREGPPGTRYHSLLVEGYIDGPIDACLCVSWESTLYKKWWPQSVVPTFKIVSSKCLQKVRIGEQISVMRMKVPWPLLPREAVVQYFEFEYFQDDLIVVLISTISDSENIDRSIQGFTNDGIQETKDVVRVDMLGGFAYQKVTPKRTYFRQIGNVDLKMDFVPPSLINFIARQLIGNGFRLYEKTVASAYSRNEDFSTVLGDPLYARIHKALYSSNEPNGDLEQKEIKSDGHMIDEVHSINSMQGDTRDMDQIQNDESAHLSRNMLVTNTTCKKKAFGEIKEEDEEDIKPLEEGGEGKYQHVTNNNTGSCYVNGGKNTFISREVEQALGTLEKVIYMVREHGLPNKQTPAVENGLAKDPTPLKDMESSNAEVCAEVSKVQIKDKSSDKYSNGDGGHELRPTGSNCYSTEVTHNRIVLQEQKISNPSETHRITTFSDTNGTAHMAILDKTELHTKHMAHGDDSIQVKGNKQTKSRLCCIKFNFGHLTAREETN